jgi:hypothetical protein
MASSRSRETRAGEQQARHIHAGDEQHEADRTQEQPECRADIFDQLLLHPVGGSCCGPHSTWDLEADRKKSRPFGETELACVFRLACPVEQERPNSIENKQLARGLKKYPQRNERALTLTIHPGKKRGLPWPALKTILLPLRTDWEKEMAKQARTTHGIMEGGGSYNLHAKIPAGGGSLALPFLEQAVRNATLDGVERPVVIADYGSSQGKHSLAPMRAAIIALRARLGPDRPILDILVVHIDQAANDFNTLFDVLHSDPAKLFRERSKPISLGDWKVVLRECISERTCSSRAVFVCGGVVEADSHADSRSFYDARQFSVAESQ